MEFKIKRGGHADFARIWPMVEFDFRGEGLIEQRYLQRGMLNLSAELLLLKDLDGVELGYAYVQKRSLYGYVLLAYLAVYPTFRGAGAGTRFLELIKEYYADRQGIFLEVFGDVDEGAPRRRHALYEGLGWRDVHCDYKLLGTPSKLMLLPIKGPEDVTQKVRLIIRELYEGVLPYDKARSFYELSITE